MKVTCIMCPLGCSINIEEKQGEILDIKGHGCNRGLKFAKAEFYNPQRMVTTIVTLAGGEYPYLPVISDGEVPKECLKDCIKSLHKTRVKAPVEMGDIIIENVLGTNVNIVAAKTAKVEER
ncbi:MAG TPA: DUF1667 domain-containing protein [Candidatus Eisenbacteria bacterium]|nr:DUF1667 domain-containing protein [Candidatus Eisenbacteria bacterium]